jgi:hypothetical protein
MVTPRVQIVQTSSGLAFVRDGKQYEHGFFGGGLGEAVAGVPEAVQHASTYQGLQVGGFLLTVGGAASVGIGIAQTIRQADSVDATDRQAASILLIGGAAMALVGGILYANGPPHLWDAINVYNDATQRAAVEKWRRAHRRHDEDAPADPEP